MLKSRFAPAALDYADKALVDHPEDANLRRARELAAAAVAATSH